MPLHDSSVFTLIIGAQNIIDALKLRINNLCIKLITKDNYYTRMHSQQNVNKNEKMSLRCWLPLFPFFIQQPVTRGFGISVYILSLLCITVFFYSL
jgi:hypothetical protein